VTDNECVSKIRHFRLAKTMFLESKNIVFLGQKHSTFGSKRLHFLSRRSIKPTSWNHDFSKKRHLRVVRNGVFTRSIGIYKWMVTAERPLDDVGKGVSNVWNDPKQTLRKHYVGSTWFQIRLYLHPNETLLWTQTDFTCTKSPFCTLPCTPSPPFLPIRV